MVFGFVFWNLSGIILNVTKDVQDIKANIVWQRSSYYSNLNKMHVIMKNSTITLLVYLT